MDGDLGLPRDALNTLKIISVTINCPSECKTLLLKDMEAGSNRKYLYMHIFI